MVPRTTTAPRDGRRGVLARGGIVAIAAALTMTGGVGAALASPADVTARAGLDQIRLDAAQRQQVQSQLDARRDGARPAGLPAAGPTTFFVQTSTPSTSEVYTDSLPAGEAAAGAAASSAAPAAEAAAASVATAVDGAVPAAEVLYETSTVLNGVAVRADAADYDALAALPDVVAVHPINTLTTSNTGAASVTDAISAWQDLGNTGQDVSIGVIDTGIDYTHTDFGGSGDVAQFDAIQAAEASPAPAGVYPNAKVVGGHDFVGDAYDADPTSPTYSPVPVPDDNPLDCNGHGSHVAGTAAGYGVNADGSTYTGGYDAVPADLRIGPGMAPEASLYALKVFGCEGSTDATLQAIEWAADPDGDGDPSDHLDVINLSLGSDYGLADSADALAIDAVSELGVVAVLAAGNAGDSYDIGGSPGNAPQGIGVAASNDGYGVFDGFRVVSPEGVLDGNRPGLRSGAYTTPGDVEGPLALPVAGDDPTACSPWSGDYTGQIVLIEADGFACGSVAKGGTARDAGAAGFMIIADDDLLETGINGVPEIPGILTTASDGAVLADAVGAGTDVVVTFGDSLAQAAVATDPAQVDLLASFSSRGGRQANGVKPDVAAPGVTVFSAGVGSGSGGETLSGTSMASPVTAGIAALVASAHPEWTPEQVKADLMNTAVHDVHTADGTVYGPNRIGAGRIDARAALDNTVLAYAEAGSGVVSASFGVVEVAQETATDSREVTVTNTGTSQAVFRVSYDGLVDSPGVSYALSAQRLTIPAGQSRTVTVTMNAVQDDLLKVADPTVVTDDGRQFLGEESGRVVLTPVGRGEVLRVPVHANAKPSSSLTPQADLAARTITLTGEGVANGEAYQAESYTSLVSGFELLGHSPELPRCGVEPAPTCYQTEQERSVDLAEVGVASDALEYPDSPGVYFAVSSHGTFQSAATVENYGVYVDATADGVWDYLVSTYRIPDYDVPLVVVADRDYQLVGDFVGAMNVFDGLVDTNAFDSDVQVLGVPLSAMPLVQGRISFGVQATSAYGTVDDLGTTTVDGSPELAAETMSFDPTAPTLSFSSGGTTALMVPAADGTVVDVAVDVDSAYGDRWVGGEPGVMMVLSHNDSATGRTQLLTPSSVGATDATVFPTG